MTKTKSLAKLNHFFERLQLNELVTHFGGLAPLLNGLGASTPADGALLATQTSQANQEEFIQRSQPKSIVIQLLIQAGPGGIGFGVVGLGLGLGVGLVVAKTAQFLQLLQAAPLLNAAQVDEPFELEVATLVFEELMLSLVERLNKLGETGLLKIAGIARDRYQIG